MPQGNESNKGYRVNIRHVPYHVSRTLSADAEQKEYIKEDDAIGLRTAGRSGYIINFGPGSIEVKIFDGNEWTDWITIASGRGINIYYEDNVWVHTLRIKTGKLLGATYDITVSGGIQK